MDASALISRVTVRFTPDEVVPGNQVITEMLQTVVDRLLIRLDVDELPERAHSIVVDAAIKALRLRGYEGSTSESSVDGGSISNSFIDDVLSAYSEDIERLYRTSHRSGIKFI